MDESGIVPPQGARPVRMAEEASHADSRRTRSPDDRQQRPVLLGRQAGQLRHRAEATHRQDGRIRSTARWIFSTARASSSAAARRRRRSRASSRSRPAAATNPSAVDLDVVRAARRRGGGGRRTATPQAVRDPDEQKRLTLSRWQTVGAVIVVVGDRDRRVRHGHLRLCRGARLGLQDRRLPERLPRGQRERRRSGPTSQRNGRIDSRHLSTEGSGRCFCAL